MIVNAIFWIKLRGTIQINESQITYILHKIQDMAP